MYDPRHDADNDQDEFRRVIARPLLRHFEKVFRTGRLADSPIPPLHAFQVGIHESGAIARRV